MASKAIDVLAKAANRTADLALTKVTKGGGSGAGIVTRNSTSSRWEETDPLQFILKALIEKIAMKDDRLEALEALAFYQDAMKTKDMQRDKITHGLTMGLGHLETEVTAMSAKNDDLAGVARNQEKQLTQAVDENAKLFSKLGLIKTDLADEKQERASMHKELGDVTKQLVDVKTKVATAQRGGGGNETRKHNIRAERRERETNVIVRGMPYTGHEETQKDIEDAVWALLGTMPFAYDPRIRVIQRLVNKKKPRPTSGTPPPVLISFDGMDHKKALFAGLPEWGKINKEFKFAHDVPPLLKTEHDALEKRAYEMRKSEPGTKTRVVIKDVTVVLLAKKPGETRFEPVKAAGADAPVAAAAPAVAAPAAP